MCFVTICKQCVTTTYRLSLATRIKSIGIPKYNMKYIYYDDFTHYLLPHSHYHTNNYTQLMIKQQWQIATEHFMSKITLYYYQLFVSPQRVLSVRSFYRQVLCTKNPLTFCALHQNGYVHFRRRLSNSPSTCLLFALHTHVKCAYILLLLLCYYINTTIVCRQNQGKQPYMIIEGQENIS